GTRRVRDARLPKPRDCRARRAVRIPRAWSWRHLDDAHRYPGIQLVDARGDDLLPCRQPARDDRRRLGPGADLDALLDQAAVRFIDEPYRRLPLILEDGRERKLGALAGALRRQMDRCRLAECYCGIL